MQKQLFPAKNSETVFTVQLNLAKKENPFPYCDKSLRSKLRCSKSSQEDSETACPSYIQ